MGHHLRPLQPAEGATAATTIYWLWGPAYANITTQVQAKTYKAGYEYFDASTQALGLFGFMEGQPQPGIADLPAADVQSAKDTLAKMLAPDTGKTARFDIVFTGPIKDNTGKQILAAGQKLEQAYWMISPADATCKVCMHWWADGVNATIPY